MRRGKARKDVMKSHLLSNRGGKLNVVSTCWRPSLEDINIVDGPKNHNPNQNIHSLGADFHKALNKRLSIEGAECKCTKRDLTVKQPLGSIDQTLLSLKSRTFSHERRERSDSNSTISTSFKLILNGRDQERVAKSQWSANEPWGSKTIM